MNTEAKLDIAVCTLGQKGLDRFASTNPPAIPKVRYVVSLQSFEGVKIPEAIAKREDIVIFKCSEKGLSANRNNALEKCTAELVLIADDDVTFDKEGIIAAIKSIESEKDIALATFIVKRPSMPDYPDSPCILGKKRLPKGYWPVSVEIMVRRELVREIRFDTRLGLGNELMSCGEELRFVQVARRRDLKCKFFPIIIGEHPAISTGLRVTPGIIRAQGCYIALEHGRLACIPRLWLKSYRILRQNPHTNPLKTLLYLHQGQYQSLKFPYC